MKCGATRFSRCRAAWTSMWRACGPNSTARICYRPSAASVTGSAETVRSRLLMVLLTFAAVAVTGFAWPLLSSTAAERTQRWLIDRSTALDRFAVLAQHAVATGDYLA